MEHRVDGRTLHSEPDDEAIAALRRLQPSWFALEMELARLLWRVKRKRAGAPVGLTQIQHVAQHLGYDGYRAQDLAKLGEALELRPDLEDLLREKKIHFQAAVALALPLGNPQYQRPEDPDWVELAQTLRLKDLRDRIKKRRAEIDGGEGPTHKIEEHVTDKAHRDLQRSQEIATRRAGKFVTMSQTIGAIARHYVESFDRLEKTARRRRAKPTALEPDSRYVPSDVNRGLEERSGGICEVGGCEYPAYQRCHFDPHAEGSGRELKDLFHGCRECHKAYDLEWLRLHDWTEDGRPRFVVPWTGEILEPKPRPNRGPPAAGGG